MMNLLGATEGIGWTIVLVVLIVLMVVYLVFATINRKKAQEQANKMLGELKKGDKIVTNAGIYGEVVSMRETNMGKVVIIKTGHDDDNNHASYITVNASVILGIDTKEDLILDAEGNVIEPTADLKEEVLKEKATEKKTEEKVEDKKEKTTSEKKPAGKSSSKANSAKKKTSAIAKPAEAK